MTITTADTVPVTTAGGPQWGRGAELRAARDYLGLTLGEFAEVLNIARRSYQRMERAQAPIPATLWGTIDGLHAEFDELVDTLSAYDGVIVVELWDTERVGVPTIADGPDVGDPPYLRQAIALAVGRTRHQGVTGRAPLVVRSTDDIAAIRDFKEGRID